MLNRVILDGRLTKKPELKKTGNDKSLCNFTIANQRYGTKEGQNADFINCVAWGHNADFLTKYADKGDLVTLEGRLSQNQFTTKDGQQVSTYVVVAEKLTVQQKTKKDIAETPSETTTAAKKEEPKKTYNAPVTLDFGSDDLPF